MVGTILFVYVISLFIRIDGQSMPCGPDSSWSWTPWFNFHEPNSQGEYELHSAIRSQHPSIVCTTPYGISAVNQAGIDMNKTTDMIVLRSFDVFCLNNYHPRYQHKRCDDYSVRYCCPKFTNSTNTDDLRELFISSSNTRFVMNNNAKSAQLKCGRAPRAATLQYNPGTGLLLSLIGSLLPKIINGVEARPNSWPWLVSIGIQYRGPSGVWQNRTHVCGGALIGPSHVLTAAHCVEQKIDDRYVPLTSTNPSVETFFILRIGIHDIRSTQSSEIYRAKQVYVHENFISSTFENDIALIRLDRPVPMTENTSPICLPSASVKSGRRVLVAGWGTVAETSRVHSNVLRQATINVLPSANCRVYSDVRFDSSRQLCAASLDWSKDTCAGDSGGPLMYQESGMWSVGGITSYGYGCARRGFPGVYTRTLSYLPWIKTRMLMNP